MPEEEAGNTSEEKRREGEPEDQCATGADM
jgi:hypothetical protein